jgi:hypothetical protein
MKEKSIFLFNSVNETIAVLIKTNAAFKAWKLFALGFKQMGYAAGNSDKEILDDAKNQLTAYSPTFMTYAEMNKMRKSRGL